MYVNISKIQLPWCLFRWWGGYDRSANGDHIFDFKWWRIRINFKPAIPPRRYRDNSEQKQTEGGCQ